MPVLRTDGIQMPQALGILLVPVDGQPDAQGMGGQRREGVGLVGRPGVVPTLREPAESDPVVFGERPRPHDPVDQLVVREGSQPLAEPSLRQAWVGVRRHDPVDQLPVAQTVDPLGIVPVQAHGRLDLRRQLPDRRAVEIVEDHCP